MAGPVQIHAISSWQPAGGTGGSDSVWFLLDYWFLWFQLI